MKKLGQHFLTSKKLLKEIAELAGVCKEDVVLEIGTGDGRLTEEIAKRAKLVYTVEIDENLLEKARRRLRGFKNVRFIHGDALKLEFPKDVNKVVSNLPYWISSEITEKMLDFLTSQRKRFPKVKALLMYQKEFAQRMVAEPYSPAYSRLSVLVAHLAQARIVKIVQKRFFLPRPKVDSALVELIPKRMRKDELLLKMAQILFQHKNKKVIKSLIDSRRYLKLKDKARLRKLLKERLGELAELRVWELYQEDLKEIKRKIGDLIDRSLGS
jgi:16S rRNA (adenine1518-N6/adenine1519-N6)-dimethyltransferase